MKPTRQAHLDCLAFRNALIERMREARAADNGEPRGFVRLATAPGDVGLFVKPLVSGAPGTMVDRRTDADGGVTYVVTDVASGARLASFEARATYDGGRPIRPASAKQGAAKRAALELARAVAPDLERFDDFDAFCRVRALCRGES